MTYDRESGEHDRNSDDPTFDQIEATTELLRSFWPDSRFTRADEWSPGVETPPQILRRMVSWPSLCERQRWKVSDMETQE